MSATVRSVGRDTSRYNGPEGEADFEAFGAMYGGEFPACQTAKIGPSSRSFERRAFQKNRN